MGEPGQDDLVRRARAVHARCERDGEGCYRVVPGMLADIESLVGAGWAEWRGEDGFRARYASSLAELADRHARPAGGPGGW